MAGRSHRSASRANGSLPEETPTQVDAVFIINSLAFYRRSVFEHLHALLPRGVAVVALAEAEPNRRWNEWRDIPFRVEILRGPTITLAYERFLHVKFGLGKALATFRPRVIVVGGWSSPAYWQALAHAARSGASVLVWTTTHAGTASQDRLRRLLRRSFLRRVDGVIAASAAAASFAVAEGAPPGRVVVVGQPVDAEAIASAASRFRSSEEGRRLRETLGAPAFLYAGQLIDRKNVASLLDGLAAAAPGSSLLIAGDGPLEPSLRARAAALPSIDVRFLGFVEPPRVHELLGVVDALVLPSTEETWGTVVNEALAAGVYPLVSSACGAAEAIEPGITGEVFAPTTEALANAIRTAVGRLPLSDEEQDRVAARGHELGIERTAAAYAQAIRRFSARAGQRVAPSHGQRSS